MTLILWKLMAAILLVFPSMNTVIERHTIAGSSFGYAEEGTRRAGALACWDTGRIVLFWSDALTKAGEAHEYVHGLDCADDGLLNGSPGWPRPASYEEALAIVHRERPGVLSSAEVWYGWAGTMGRMPILTARCGVVRSHRNTHRAVSTMKPLGSVTEKALAREGR